MEPAAQSSIQIPEDTLDVINAGINYRDNHNWITWVWAALSREGDAPASFGEDDIRYPSNLITLAGLGHLFDQFQDTLSGFTFEDEIRLELLGKDRPRITEIELARYCEHHGYFDDETPETGSGLERVAVIGQADKMRNRLCELLGDARAFTALVVAGRPLAPPDFDHDDLEDDDFDIGAKPLGSSLTPDAFDPYMDEVLNADITADKQCTYAWFTGDLDLS